MSKRPGNGNLLDTRARVRKPYAPFELGAHVRYTQRAAVARRTMQDRVENEWSPWGLYDGWPINAMVDPQLNDLLKEFEPGERINKAVFVWDEQGAGIVIGLIKKQVGESSPGYRSNTPYGDDFEPGYFTPVGEPVWLYAIKHRLEGLDFILVPVDVVTNNG